MNFRPDPLAERVAAAWLRSGAGWVNAINGEYFSLLWNNAKWHVEEMANGDKMPSTTAFGENLDIDRYEMPVLDKAVKAKMGMSFSLTVDTVRSFAKLHSSDKGPQIRQKIIEAHEHLFKTMPAELRSDGRTGEAEKFEHLVPELRRKLVWKKLPKSAV